MWLNEVDPFPAAWQRVLMDERHLPSGQVDERSIADVFPADLAGLRECHFFAGIGVWPLALRLAGWPTDRVTWTGSCPCQPFSGAGKGKGFADERHLWPLWFHLIEHCEPECILGEQVEGADGRAWLDLVFADLEGLGYACGATVAPAAGFGAPHGRHRLYWMAIAQRTGLEGHAGNGDDRRQPGWIGAVARGSVAAEGAAGGLADAYGTEPEQSSRLRHRAGHPQGGRAFGEPDRHGAPGGLADAGRERGEHLGLDVGAAAGGSSGEARQQRLRSDDRASGGAGGLAHADGRHASTEGLQRGGQHGQRAHDASVSLGADRPGPTNGLWDPCDWIYCRDERWRPVESSPLSLADDGAIRRAVAGGRGDGFHHPLAPQGAFKNRVGMLRGAGNALCLAQAVEFVSAVMETLP